MKTKLLKFFPFLIVTAFFAVLWSWIGVSVFRLNADVSRDLSQLSNLWIGKIVWLGPQLKVGFPVSPLYFYLLFPGLVLMGGSAYSTILTQVLFALIALFFFYHFEKADKKWVILLPILFIGLSSWWLESTVKLWNGHMYVSCLLLSLVFLWHRKKLWLSSLFFGIAVSIHPAVLLTFPLFLYEAYAYKSRNLVTKVVSVLGGLTLPWAPIIVFEFLSKGFLIREWLKDRNPGMELEFGLHNIKLIASLSGITLSIFVALLIFTSFFANKRLKKWLIAMVPAGIFLSFVSQLLTHYLLPVLVVLFFIIAKVLVKKQSGRVIIILFIIFFASKVLMKYSLITSWPPDNRLEEITTTLETMIENDQINKNNSYALISIIDEQNSTPQADDYRFVLRTKGYVALEIAEYPSADYLLIFFENNQENPENWSDWHSEYFGSKVLVSSKIINDTQVLVYKRM